MVRGNPNGDNHIAASTASTSAGLREENRRTTCNIELRQMTPKNMISLPTTV